MLVIVAQTLPMKLEPSRRFQYGGNGGGDGDGGDECDDDFQDVERMGDVLNHLGNVQVTLAVLQESKVGATVSKLKKHSNEGVSNSAKALVKKWKRVAEASGVQGGAAAASPAGKPERSKSAPVSAAKGDLLPLRS